MEKGTSCLNDSHPPIVLASLTEAWLSTSGTFSRTFSEDCSLKSSSASASQVELADAGEVRKLSPNFRKLAAIDARGIIATASAGTALIDGKRVDFISRFFAPASGIDEDPVTGSAHCTLGPYWSEKFNKSELLAYQVRKPNC
jgi:PhzF family phenazine biosynthesis protein